MKHLLAVITIVAPLHCSLAQEPATPLKLSIEAEETKWKSSKGEGVEGRKEKSTRYSLRYKNVSSNALTDVRVEYCTYRDREHGGGSFIQTDSDSKSLGTIAPNKSEDLWLAGMGCFKKERTGFLNAADGCRVRVYFTDPNGKEKHLELCHPRTLDLNKYAWNTPENRYQNRKNQPANEALFKNPNALIITGDMSQGRWKKDDGHGRVPGRKSKTTLLLLRLQNQGTQPLFGVRAEYCTYRQRLHTGKEYVSSDISESDVGLIAPGEWKYNSLLGIPISFENDDFLNEVIGARVRIYLPSANGKEIMRQIWIPESLADSGYPWVDSDYKPIEQAGVEEQQATAYTSKKKPATKKASPKKTRLVNGLTPTEYHTLSTANGESIEGRLTDYRETAGFVILEQRSGKKQNIQFASLSEKSQSSVQDWYAAGFLLNKNKIRIKSLKRGNTSLDYHGRLDEWAAMFPELKYDDDWHTHFPGLSYDKVFYDISLENRSGTPQKNIRVEYCIFHETDICRERIEEKEYRADGDMSGWWPLHEKKGKSRTVQHTLSGTIQYEEIADRKRTSQTTDSFHLVEKAEVSKLTPQHSRGRYRTGDKADGTYWEIEGNLIGIRYRVYVPIKSGGYAMKEFAEPSSILRKTTWPADL